MRVESRLPNVSSSNRVALSSASPMPYLSTSLSESTASPYVVSVNRVSSAPSPARAGAAIGCTVFNAGSPTVANAELNCAVKLESRELMRACVADPATGTTRAPAPFGPPYTWATPDANWLPWETSPCSVVRSLLMLAQCGAEGLLAQLVRTCDSVRDAAMNCAYTPASAASAPGEASAGLKATLPSNRVGLTFVAIVWRVWTIGRRARNVRRLKIPASSEIGYVSVRRLALVLTLPKSSLND